MRGRGHSDSEVAYLAYHDALTGLANRTLLHEYLEETLERASRDGGTVALVYIDLNDFKLVNDSLGHAAGDELLVQVATRLRSVTRSSDVLARQGGDEFLVLLAGLEGGAGGGSVAREVAERMWEKISAVLDEPFEIGDAVFQIGASAGVSVFPEDAGDAETLEKHADAAMYSAKSAGGGIAAYEPNSSDPLARLSLAARMRRALAANEFELHYQPIYEFEADAPPRIRGVEALIRWRDSEWGLIPPAEFIPAAERTGVIDAIGDWVLEELMCQAAGWRDQGLVPSIGINVSPPQLRRPGFAEAVVERILAHGLEPTRFVIELTESSWMLEAARVIPVLEALAAAGVRLALDDFGAGYSSLARLRALPAHVIKIDRAFLQGIPGDRQAAAIVGAILALAEACECDVVAEGVETAAQLQFLRQRGCRLAQGYHLCRPGPAESITPLMKELLLPGRRL